MRITEKWLRDNDACDKHVRKFKRGFPDGCNLNPKNIRTAQDSGLDVGWLAWEVMPEGFASEADGVWRQTERELREQRDQALVFLNAIVDVACLHARRHQARTCPHTREAWQAIWKSFRAGTAQLVKNRNSRLAALFAEWAKPKRKEKP